MYDNIYPSPDSHPSNPCPYFRDSFRISLTYYVRPGDSLYKIGVMYNISVAELKRANNLTSDLIHPGQALVIPNFTLPSGVYGPGSSGVPVRNIQLALYAMGHNITVDGYYGPETTVIITSIQKKYPEALVADGIYGSNTKYYLETLIAKSYRIVQYPNSVLVLVNKQNSLSYDYIPPDLTVPNVPFSFEGFAEKRQMRNLAAKALEAMFAQASRENIALTGVSGFRSFNRQAEIFSRNIAADPNANQTSARPGESEHQTGLAIDVSSLSVGNALTVSFADTKEGQWLAANAPAYGFIIRFPKGKEAITGYQYEPWHIRYVGPTAARQISAAGITLEEYLGQG